MQRGTRLGEFRLEADLGMGGMGGVFQGSHAKTGEVVAIKTLHARFDHDDQMRARFLREAEIYRRMQHPNVVQYRGSGIQDGVSFIVLEYVDGRTLEELIRFHGIELGREASISILRDLLRAVGYCHAQGVVHRDLKPKNVMVNREGQVKLLDFGVAANEDNLVQTQIGSILGSFHYSSPEQNQGQSVDERSDLYSLGLIFYELLTGRRALDGTTLLMVLHQQTEGNLPRPGTYHEGLPQVLDELFAQMTATRRQDRPSQALEVLEILDKHFPDTQS